ncbi:hypothetical protein MTO96_004208 [Rhipicephalus appendiculatus]
MNSGTVTYSCLFVEYGVRTLGMRPVKAYWLVPTLEVIFASPSSIQAEADTRSTRARPKLPERTQINGLADVKYGCQDRSEVHKPVAWFLIQATEMPPLDELRNGDVFLLVR